MGALNATNKREYEFTQADFIRTKEYLSELTGIRLADSKDALVYSRLVRRVRFLKQSSIGAYLDYVTSHNDETEHFINALTTNLTSFFREPHHFDILESELRTNKNIRRIWCAAASTGEEPYSIAMIVAKVFGRFDTPIEIIASDIDSNVLATAKAGVYPIARIESLDDSLKKSFFLKGKGVNEGLVSVVPSLKKMIQFKRINLLDNHWPIDKVDILFCRNVMIYFDKQTQSSLLEKMMSVISANGLYVAGHSENFSYLNHLVKPCGKTTYRPIK